MEILDKIFNENGWSSKRLVALTGSISLMVALFTSDYNDAIITTVEMIVITAIAGNVVGKFAPKG